MVYIGLLNTGHRMIMANQTRLVEYSGSSESEEEEEKGDKEEGKEEEEKRDKEDKEEKRDNKEGKEEEELPLKREKRKKQEIRTEENKNIKKKCLKNSLKERLPLPDDIKNLFKEKENNFVDDPNLHEGRLRSFPHLEGNWATHVFIEVELKDSLFELQQILFSQLKPYVELKPMSHYHISLSKTVAIRHHWIQPLTQELSKAFQQFSPTFCTFHSVKFFCNEEKTRTFLILEIDTNIEILMRYISKVDQVFKEFNLPPFYTNPSFHISIGWSLGNFIPSLPESLLSQLQPQVTKFLAEQNLKSGFIPINEIQCRTGNKIFYFPLKNSIHKSKINT